MANSDNVDFRQTSNADTDSRPLSVYDNLNTNANVNTINTSTPIKSDQHQLYNNVSSSTCEPDTEYPFSDISFKFDDLPTRSANNSNPINGYNHFHQDNSNDSTFNNNPTNQQLSHHNQSRTPSQSAGRQYENVVDVVHHDYPVKPVMSDAKSTFFGLKSTIDDNHNGKQSNVSKSLSTKLSNAIESNEHEPLISSNVNVATKTNNKRSAEYQNIPSNSVCFTSDLNQNIAGNGNAIKPCDSDINQSKNYPLSDSTMMNSSNSITTNNPSLRPLKQFTSVDNSNDKINHNLSQAVYMTTTVPQNIKGTNIMGSHTPTRSSLRHSRMLVINKNYQVPRRRNSLNIKHPIWAKVMLAFHILIGLAVSCLGLWLCWWAPSTRSRDNPYWSGLILILSGILGCVIFGFRRIPRHKLREHLFKFFYLNSTLITVVAALSTLAASIFAANHILQIVTYGHQCEPAFPYTPTSSCICNYSKTNSTSQSRAPAQNESDLKIEDYEFYYRDLNCNEVIGAFKYILIASSILNFIGFLICSIFLSLLCVKTTVNRKPYAPVRTTQ